MSIKYTSIIIISLLSCIVALLGVLVYSAPPAEQQQEVTPQMGQPVTEYDYKWYAIDPVMLIAGNNMNYKKQITPDIIHFPDGWEYVAPLHSGTAGVEYVLLRRPKNARKPFKQPLRKGLYDSSSQKLRDWKGAATVLDMTIGAPK